MENLIGKIFGRLKVVDQINNDKFGHSRWLCLCNCGKIKIIAGRYLKSGDIKSCGCINKELVGQKKFKTRIQQKRKSVKNL